MHEDGIVSYYGHAGSWEEFGNSYKGLIPLDNKQFAKEIQKNGIMFVAHSKSHYDNNTPSQMLFEAAAASNVYDTDCAVDIL